ncbi:MAG: DUF2283 domain-containing protein [Cytophagales bacterium]|jgi:uncharacterized protein YuzE|nr:DUF2283 domain-containing protein [Cytophagales bacterium]
MWAITYDPQVDAAYISFVGGGGKCADSCTAYTNVVFDYDSNNKLVGIEFLQVSKRQPELLEMLRKRDDN